jgi:hypothetical protein
MIGELISHYPITRQIGAGGMGGTFAADFGTACEAFNLNSVGTATLDGLVSFNVFQFGFNSDTGTNPGSFYIFHLGSLACGTLSSSFFNAASGEVFVCGQDLSTPQAFVTDSLGTTMSGPCTPKSGHGACFVCQRSIYTKPVAFW